MAEAIDSDEETEVVVHREIAIAHANNQRVDELRLEKNLTRKQIAKICGCSKSWVDSWLSKPGSKYYRECPDSALKLLEFELGVRQPEHTDKIRELQAQIS